MSRRRPAFTAVLGLSALLAQPASAREPVAGSSEAGDESRPADASVVAAAEAHASAAYEAYLRKDYAQAIALYEQALAVAPNAALVLYNIARIYDVGLHSRGLAIDYYHRFIAAPNAPPAYILNARARIADLEIAERAAVNQTMPAGASPSEWAPAVDPGTQDAALAVPRAATDAPRPATLERLPVAPPRNGPSLPPAEESAWTSREVAALAVGGAGVASVGLGVGFLLSAGAKSDIWKRDCNGNDCSTQRAVDAAESASKQVSVGTAALFAGGALIALGGVLWFVDFSSEAPAERASSASSSWTVSPTVSASEISAAFSTRF